MSQLRAALRLYRERILSTPSYVRPVGKFLRCTEYSGTPGGQTWQYEPHPPGHSRGDLHLWLKLAYEVALDLKRRSWYGVRSR